MNYQQGGFSGIATIIYYLFKIPLGLTMIVINVPLFLFSAYKMGKEFLIKSIIGTISLSVFIDFFDNFQAFTNDKFLACIYGGILTGLGTAIILKAHSSTGGSDLLTFIINQYNKFIEMSKVLVVIDIIIVALNVIFLKNLEIGLYSAIAIYLMGKIIDVVFEGVNFTKLLIIISDKNNEISDKIVHEIERGVTGLYGKGMYTKKDKLVLICAVSRRDLANIKALVKEIDPKSFIVVTNSREVLGRGFKEQV